MRKVERVDRVCQYCGKHFSVFPFRVKKGEVKFCSKECQFRAFQATRIKRVCQQCGKDFTITPWQLKTGRGKFCSFRCRCDSQIGKCLSRETRRKLSLFHTEQARDPKYLAKLSVAQHSNWQKPEYRARVSRGIKVAKKRDWQNQEFVAKMLASLNRKPTKPEKGLIDILAKHLPDFKYNGDFSLSVILGGLVPDFVNVNARKEVIEVFGDYFHSPEVLGNRWQGSELGKVMIYNSLGYKCLVIWEHELKELSEDEIIDKVKSFFKDKKKARR